MSDDRDPPVPPPPMPPTSGKPDVSRWEQFTQYLGEMLSNTHGVTPQGGGVPMSQIRALAGDPGGMPLGVLGMTSDKAALTGLLRWLTAHTDVANYPSTWVKPSTSATKHIFPEKVRPPSHISNRPFSAHGYMDSPAGLGLGASDGIPPPGTPEMLAAEAGNDLMGQLRKLLTRPPREGWKYKP